MELAVKMTGITKRFPGILANDRVDFEVRQGEIMALIGENGAGKTTLMNILYGLQTPDSGEIQIMGQSVRYTSAIGAIRQGIGMVHQHFMLIPRLSIAENIVLGNEPGTFLKMDNRKAEQESRDLMRSLGIQQDPRAPVSGLSLGTQQKVEIMKVLYRKAKIIILDEPTAVLTPQEIVELGQILRALKAQGATVIIITHKLQEVIDFSDRITIMRRGRVAGVVETGQCDIRHIVQLMVGRNIELNRKKIAGEVGQEVLLEIQNLSYVRKNVSVLKDISLVIHAGEILGVAGIDGSGQDELTEILDGMCKPTGGQILLLGQDVARMGAMERRNAGFAFIPQDRQRYGLAGALSVEENLVLGFERQARFQRHGFISRKNRRQAARQIIGQYDIRTPDETRMAGGLSGGNQQKMIIAREMSMHPQVIIANQPTRGVDIGAIESIHDSLVQARSRGKGVLLVSLELDELLSLCDRIAVIYSGQIMGILDGAEATREQIGLLMVGKTAPCQDSREVLS